MASRVLGGGAASLSRLIGAGAGAGPNAGLRRGAGVRALALPHMSASCLVPSSFERNMHDSIHHSRSRYLSGASGGGVSASNAGRKRFYKEVSVMEVRDDSTGGTGFMVALDGRPIKTPHRNSLVVRTQALAQALAHEWDSQKLLLIPSSMPLMTLSCTAIDIAEDRREGTQEELLRFLRTDTLLFPGIPGEDDPNLIRLQRQHWSPLVEWMRETFGQVHECTNLGIPPHPEDTNEKVNSFLSNLDPWELSAVESLTSGCKSIILPLAIYHGVVNVEGAVQAARVEEEHQVSQWGLVEGGHDVDRAQLIAQVAAATFFLKSS